MPMKKVFIPACAAILVYLTSCTQTASTSGESSTEKTNLAADSVISAAFRTGDASKVDSVVAADFVNHTDQGDKNRDSLKVMIKMVHDSFPGMKMNMVNQASNGDYVYSWMNFTGNSNGEMGIPKGPYDWHIIQLSKYKDGKAVEHWEFIESRTVAKMQEEMMKQMQQNMGNKMGNSKKK